MCQSQDLIQRFSVESEFSWKNSFQVLSLSHLEEWRHNKLTNQEKILIDFRNDCHVRRQTDFVKASKKKKVILLEAKNYDVFIRYKMLHKKEKNIIRSNKRTIL